MLIYTVRENLIRIYKSNETVVLLVFRLLVGFLLFSVINGIGHYSEDLGFLVKPPLGFLVLLGCSLLFALLPLKYCCLPAALMFAVQVSASLVALGFVLLVLLLVTLFYGRLFPKQLLLIPVMMLGLYFKVPYAVVLFSGYAFGLSAIFPVATGVFLWNMLPLLNNIFGQVTSEGVSEVDVYITAFKSITVNVTWIFTAFVFAMVIFAVHIIRTLKMNYAKELSILTGMLLLIVCFSLGAFMVDGMSLSVIGMIVSCLVSAVIVEIIAFFDSLLDYESSERVRFEDDENVYFVKIIPKR